MFKKLSRAFLAVAVFIVVAKVNGQDPSEKIPLDAKVKVGKLSNGLTYYIRQNKKPENKVELRLVVNAGSILEDSDQQGLAHFTEHMAFNGSKHFKKNELVNFLQKIGVEFGADLNAYTGFDETVYILPIPLSDTGNFRKGMQVLQDWASNLTMDNTQIDGERGVVLEESRLGKGAEDRMFRKIYPLQYEGSKYAERIPIGKDSILKNFKYDAIKRFYKDWYRPDLMAVIVVGDIDPAKAEKMVKDYFGSLKNPATQKERTFAQVLARQKDTAIVVTDKEATNFVAEIDYPFYKTTPETTAGDYRKTLVKGLFTSLINQRLNELTQSSNPPFLYASTGFNSYARGYEGFSGFTVAGQSGPDSALMAVTTEIERAKKFGFTSAELERAKKQMLASIEKIYNDREKSESDNYVQEYIAHFLQQEPTPGIEWEFDQYKKMMPTITIDEVNAVADKLKQNEHVFVSLQGPAQNSISLPDSKALLATVEAARKGDIKPYEEKAVATELLSTKPTPGTITSEAKKDVLGVTELTFANGAKVILKPTDFKNDEIIMSGFHKGGTSSYGPEDKYNGSYASTIVNQMGIGDFSPTDLRKALAGKVASASARVSGLSSGISGSSSVKDFETMLQLAYLALTNPRKDEGLFNAWRSKQKSAVQFAMADPQTYFVDTFYQVMYNKNPLAPIAVPKPEDFDKIDLNRSFEIYKACLADANDFTFIIVGSFDVEKIKPLLATYIGGLPSQHKPAQFKDNGLRLAKGNISFNVKRGTEQKSLIVQMYSGEIEYNEDLALRASALTEILNIKITDDLREKMGAIYGGGFSGSVNKYPYSYYQFVLQLPCGPENVDKLLAGAKSEIIKIKTKGPEQTDLEKVKKTWLEQHKVHLKENGYWAGALYNIYFQGDDIQRTLNYEKRVNALTVDNIKATANQLFNDKNVLQGVLYPEK
ncbi:insulinase family protein [Danxiaibacter flavus]|uniref:Insulinase family protein n=1 Tax=Danxiaibacter flavus TaxID=3049108 RepID=A0ABV3ZMU1_9BACT|nr:insulinase family protein [Chitinophagaceae bacterium DXS]